MLVWRMYVQHMLFACPFFTPLGAFPNLFFAYCVKSCSLMQHQPALAA